MFLQYLAETETVYIVEHNAHQTKKTILEILHRLPSNDYLRKHLKDVLEAMFRLVEVENEENVLICLRIIIELHKHYRPNYCEEVSVTIKRPAKHALTLFHSLYQTGSEVSRARPEAVPGTAQQRK